MPSTATQYVAEAHDTDSREFPVSRLVALDQVPLAVEEEPEEDEEDEEDVVAEVAPPPALLGTLALPLHALTDAPASRQAMTAPASLRRRVATCKRRAWVTSPPFFVVRPDGEPPRRPSISPGIARNGNEA